MKKLHELTLGTAMMLFALTACNNEAILPDAPQVNEPETPNACVLVGDDFRWEGNESHTALTIEGNVAKFSWTLGDSVGILPDSGAQVYFTIPEPTEATSGEEVTDEQRRTASFDGGAWALKAESNYAAYYPFVKDFDLDRTEVPVKYTGQKQTGTAATHLGAYDYMGARPMTTNENGGGVTFDFDHVGALVLLKFTVPEADTKLNSVTLSAEGATFITEGTYDLTSAKETGFPITSTATSESFTVGIEEYTTTTANEEVTVYFMCAPVDLSDKTIKVSVAYGEGDATLELLAVGKNLEAAGGYTLAAKMLIGDIANPVQTKKGDFAMKDGSFMKYTSDITLTDEQKANVRGIVFWTESEEGSATLTSDKIMQIDFPNCTHGLIVSLKNLGKSMWQENYANIASWQSSNSPYNGANYQKITTKDKILGYQNTTILKVYNASLESGSNNTVQLVSQLASFSNQNPAPANTTDWFIPSVKELALLLSADSKNAVNTSLAKVGGGEVNKNYWTSSEMANTPAHAYGLSSSGVTGHAQKYKAFYIRTVCAF